MAGTSANFVDTQGVELTINSIVYTQLSDITFETDSNVTKHQLTDDTINNVFSLRMNSLQGNMVVTTTEYAALVALTTDTTGALQTVVVTNDGASYTAGELVTLLGQTSAANNATGFATVNGSNVITAVKIISGGSGYTNGETLTITGVTSGSNDATGTGAGTTLTAVSSISGGTNYLQLGEFVTLSGTGSDATGFAFLSSGAITTVSLINRGTDYVADETITITGFVSTIATGKGSAKLQALARSTVSCVVKWTDSSVATKTTTFSAQLKTLRPIDSGLGLVTVFFRIEADAGITVT